MTKTAQRPLGTDFGATSDAGDVMAGVDLSGKTAIVTGGYSGIGLETVRAMEKAGARVIVPARDMKKATRALEEAGLEAGLAPMDLADLASVQNFAAEFGGQNDRLHFLINNAGIMACPETRIGPGWEAQFAVNHIGHFVLTKELAPYLKNAGGARVVCLSSLAHKRSPIRWDDIHFRNSEYEKWQAYGQSKTANALFARALNARMRDDGVLAFSAHPGGIRTPLQRHLGIEEMVALGLLDETGELSERAKARFKTPEQGCATTLWCATSPALEGHGGVYCEDCDIAPLASDASPPYAHVAAWAADDASAAKLWDVTEQMILSA